MRCLSVFLLLIAIWPCPLGAECENGQDAPAGTQSLQGRWSAFRNEKVGDKIVRRQVVLTITERRIEVSFLSEEKNWKGALEVRSVEILSKLGQMPHQVARVNVSPGGPIYCDSVGDRLYMVGRIDPRPWEGVSISGEYTLDKNP